MRIDVEGEEPSSNDVGSGLSEGPGARRLGPLPHQSREPTAFRLRGLVGDRERVFDLSPGKYRLGRSLENDIPLVMREVSRRHAVVRITPERLLIEDRGSANGTYVDGRRVCRAEVAPGAVLRLGRVSLLVESLDDDDTRLAIKLSPKGENRSALDTGLSRMTTLALPVGWRSPPVGGFSTPGASQGVNRPQHPGPRDRERGGVGCNRPELLFPDGYQPGISPRTTGLYRQMRTLLKGAFPVLICGETGVGKEMVARILHRSSDRHEFPFLAINCAAIPKELLEAELFGIGKAVATGVEPRTGIFERAASGTLLLDEVGELEPALQAKLLRALQEKEIHPVGDAPRKIDVRVLAATNADLAAQMAAGRFRRDLYYRLAGYVLEVPPLRHCRDDIPGLVEHFLKVYSREFDTRPRGLSLKALRLMIHYPWPGNVRELQHEIRRLVFLSTEGQTIDSNLLSKTIRSPQALSETDTRSEALGGTTDLALTPRVRAFEIELIREALGRSGGNQTRAARLLKMSRNGLIKKMKRLGMKP